MDISNETQSIPTVATTEMCAPKIQPFSRFNFDCKTMKFILSLGKSHSLCKEKLETLNWWINYSKNEGNDVKARQYFLKKAWANRFFHPFAAANYKSLKKNCSFLLRLSSTQAGMIAIDWTYPSEEGMKGLSMRGSVISDKTEGFLILYNGITFHTVEELISYHKKYLMDTYCISEADVDSAEPEPKPEPEAMIYK